ncbi:MAG: mechanosensitive ion channel [bacterium]|nr:mechanosensitive ion channel [bacterium]
MADANIAILGDISVQNFLLFIFVLGFTFVLGGALNVIITRLLKDKVRPAIYKSLSKFVMYTLYLVGLFIGFNNIIGFNIPASLAALGVLGIALLLPAVPVLQNIVAGIVLSISRPFREDDTIEINGEFCKVKDMMLTKTRLRASDGKIISVPHMNFLSGTPVVNYSQGEFIRISIPVDIASKAKREKAKKIIEKICAANPNILPNVPQKKMNRLTMLFEIPANFFKIPRNIKKLYPVILIKDVNKDKVSFDVRFWIWNILMKDKIISAFYEDLIKEFEKEKIKFG